jgi:hypothetical protein
MSFTNTPVTRALVLGLVGSSIAANLLDIKHYFYILVDVHVWRFHQLWRAFAYQLCYTNSSEALFAAMTVYHMRVVERLWGPRKYAVNSGPSFAGQVRLLTMCQSFLVVSYILTSIIPPALLALVLRPLTAGLFNYLPAGPTPIIFAVLAQYHAMIPHIYKYRLATSASPPTNDEFAGVTFSDKSYRYLFALQLALFQWPGSLLGAAVGWIVGYSWRNDLLPGALARWRLPGWMVGLRTQKRNQGFEGLRRRLEGEDSAVTGATATGLDVQGDGEAGRRRTMAQQVLQQIRGVL